MFENFKFLPGTNNLFVGEIPDEIFLELAKFVEHCRKIKDHPLGSLYNHENNGQNSYQISIPSPLLEQSFLFPYLIKLGEHLLKTFDITIDKHQRPVRLRSNINHFDGYDCWINFTNKGDINPLHNHAGDLSGVIYYSNIDKCPTIFENNVQYAGKSKEIIIFPASMKHYVNTHNSDNERITISFNLYFVENFMRA
jgi:hypothetical protein